MKLRRLIFLFPLLLLFPAALLLGYSSGPIPRITAGFREDTCHQCHSDFKLNEGRTIGGLFEILGVPRTYAQGQSYSITVVIGQPGQSRWGFELSVRHANSGKQAGSLAPGDAMTQVKEADGIQYLEHTSEGTRRGSADGPVEFHFTWTAPDPSGGPVFFNAAGNAADSSGSPTGDYVYTAGAYSAALGAAGSTQVAKPTRPEAGRAERISETSRLVDLPVPVDLNKGTFEVLIQHRFFESLADSSPGDAFGIDFGANINLGVNYAFTKRLSGGISRARIDQVIAVNAGYEIQTRRDSFWKMSFLAGVEGRRNFERQFSPYIQLPTSLEYKSLRLLLAPTVVFNSRDDTRVAANPSLAVHPGSDETFSLGIGTDIPITSRFSLVGEYVPRLAGFGGFSKRQPQVGGGFLIRTAAHTFTVLVSTSRDFTPGRYGVNAENSDVSLGFNIYRRVR